MSPEWQRLRENFHSTKSAGALGDMDRYVAELEIRQMSMSKLASKFELLLNAMEQVSHTATPYKYGYVDKRRALLEYVLDLEVRATRSEAGALINAFDAGAGAANGWSDCWKEPSFHAERDNFIAALSTPQNCESK